MTALIVTVDLVAIVGLWWWRSRHGVLAARRRRRVVVTLKTGRSFRGVLSTSDAQAVVLAHAELLSDPAVPVDGEVIVMWDEVEFVQKP